MTAVLETRGLSRSFGAIKAVDNVSFSLAKGELLAMIGPNGAGKSTCFNMLMGQLSPSAGEVFLNGQNIVGLKPRQIWRRGVGRTFQITSTYSSMTEALGFLTLVDMQAQADRHCAVLAYGDLKRLELAIALCHTPTLLLMDEPTAGMAPKERIALMQLTADIVQDRGVSVLFTEHDMDVVFAHAHRVMVLNRGQLIADGSVEAIRNDRKVQEIYLGGGTLFKDEKGAAHA
jgi:branched-chain amino acid transport system ATP-binding protein